MIKYTVVTYKNKDIYNKDIYIKTNG